MTPCSTHCTVILCILGVPLFGAFRWQYVSFSVIVTVLPHIFVVGGVIY
ncbi:hypothetical protein Pan241w_54170 [Gimesia alba]|uniref:Uncharacterized protein n=1 Tax=Gimesia alba TaxID=2527973 RepID=A0A517RN38_9PLAN|nr:hypothetical protein Pan241w_54170 [Gimesia alba]